LNNGSVSGSDNALTGEFAELELINKIFEQYAYVDLNNDIIMNAVMKAYAEATGDKYAAYYTAEEFEALTADSNGEMRGIGINIIENAEHNCIEVINVMPNSPALEAGVQPGDLIVYVGIGDKRESVAELGYSIAVTRLQGVVDTYAEFVVVRGNNYSDEIEFSVKRGYITTESVTYRMSDLDPNIGVVKIVEFDLTTPAQLTDAMDTLLAKGVSKFIFDVRYNPGGDLKSIIAVLSYFLNDGDRVISTLDKAGNEEISYIGVAQYSGDYAGCSISEEDIGKYKGLECVVLANDNTASAAELFTATFRDYDIAPIIGITTYGKGSMQSIMSMAYAGYEGGIKMTTRMYFPPCGESYEGVGIVPDIVVEQSDDAKKTNIYKLADADDAQMIAAVAELNK
jgi:carboxyl-terminal processing protease